MTAEFCNTPKSTEVLSHFSPITHCPKSGIPTYPQAAVHEDTGVLRAGPSNSQFAADPRKATKDHLRSISYTAPYSIRKDIDR